MFGIGGAELVVIGLLFLVVFGPNKLPSMARDLGRFVSEVRRYKDEFQSELVSREQDETSEQERTFQLAIQEGTMVPGEITVDEGDQVKLWMTSDSPIRFHLHGYVLSAEVEPGEPLDLSFEADLTGRFEIEDERTHTGLGRLIVERRQGDKP